MINIKMQELINFSIQKDINSIEVFKGYKGDDVLRISSKNKQELVIINNIALKDRLFSDLKINKISGFDLYIAFNPIQKEIKDFIESNKLPYLSV